MPIYQVPTEGEGTVDDPHRAAHHGEHGASPENTREHVVAGGPSYIAARSQIGTLEDLVEDEDSPVTKVDDVPHLPDDVDPYPPEPSSDDDEE